ncbi:hypothetical protein CR513_20388, partial [Mucuna pruriens]
MLDLGASINVMTTSIYKLLNLDDLEPTGMEIQLANKSVVQPLGILKDVLIQFNKYLYAGHGGRTIRGRICCDFGTTLFMTARTKIDVHVETLSMEFEDTFVEFNIFEALKHPNKDNSIFSIDAIDGLIEEYVRTSIGSANLVDFVDTSNKVVSNSSQKESQQTKDEFDFGQPSPQLVRVDQSTPSIEEKDISP